MKLQHYEIHEQEVARLLGAKKMNNSGRIAVSKGDAKTSAEDEYSLFIDCKCTEKDVYRLTHQDWFKLAKDAANESRVPVMPIRFVHRNTDMIAIPTWLYEVYWGEEIPYMMSPASKTKAVSYDGYLPTHFYIKSMALYSISVVSLDEFIEKRAAYGV